MWLNNLENSNYILLNYKLDLHSFVQQNLNSYPYYRLIKKNLKEEEKQGRAYPNIDIRFYKN